MRAILRSCTPADCDAVLSSFRPGGFAARVLGEIRAMGYEPTSESFGYARLYMIARMGGRWVGAADPRHNGEVRGY